MNPAAPVTTIIPQILKREGRKILKALIHCCLLFIWLLIISCRQQPDNQAINKKTIRDAAGFPVEIKSGSLRAMALSPALTEMLFALLPDSAVIAVTPHCNYPPQNTKNKPVVSVMPLDLEKIISLRPDLIFTEEGITSASDLARMRELKIPVVSFSYRKVGDVLAAMDSICRWTGAGPEAAQLCDSLRSELMDMEKGVQHIPASARKTMLALTWTDPVFAYGAETWMSDKMRLAGGKNVLDNPLGKLYPQLEREQLLKLNPDVLFGGNFEKMDSTFFRMYPELREMKAYQNRQIFELDDDLASRPGPRFLDGIREMKRLIRY